MLTAISCLLCLVAGWVAHKYAVVHYPTEAALLDAVGTRYGKKAQESIRGFADTTSEKA